MVCPVSARHFGDLGDPEFGGLASWWPSRARRDLMPELGYKPVNKYLPPRPGRMAPSRPPPSAGPAGELLSRRRPAVALGRPAAVSLTRDREQKMHPALLDHLFHDRFGRRFRAFVIARVGRAARAAARERALRLCRARDRGRARGRRPRLLGFSSRPARAGVARFLAVAVIVAVSRGGILGPDIPAGGHFRHRLGVLRHVGGLVGLCGMFAAALAAGRSIALA